MKNVWFFAVLVLGFLPLLCLAYSGGDGTTVNPYQIATLDDFMQLSNTSVHWNRSFILTADIVFDPNNPTYIFNRAPIGSDADSVTSGFQGTQFIGIFDGNNHALFNLTIHASTQDFIGMFGNLGYGGQIKNLGLENVDIQGRNYVGGLAGYSVSSITNCYGTGLVNAAGNYVGGLVGAGTAITRCYSTSLVHGASRVGGLVGLCDGTMTNCYSTGSVSGTSYIGGLIGYYGPRDGYIKNCYSAGSVSGVSYVGGFSGYNSGMNTFCFWDIETSGQTTSAGGLGKTTSQMKNYDTFLNWGCDPVWTINSGYDYPRLIWEGAPGVLITKPVYGGGTGTAADPYRIYTAEHLLMIGKTGCDLNKYFRLMNNIDLSFYDGMDGRPGYEVIGLDTPFSGVFDGHGFIISNLTYISSSSSVPAGLFGAISSATIKNLQLQDIYVDGVLTSRTGGLVGSSSSGTIQNCHITGGLITGSVYTGGLVGYAMNGTINQCSVDTTVQASGQYAGLLVGSSYGVSLESSFADGVLTGNTSTGGLIGGGSWFQIANCYSRAEIQGIENTGGLVGMLSENTSIMNSYAAGSVSGQIRTGGLVGLCSAGIISDCYWDVEAIGQTSSSGGGVGLTANIMKNPETYWGWGCASEWTIDAYYDYPRLAWEGAAGNSITRPDVVYGGGQGTVADPYLIYTPQQLYHLSLLECDWNYSFKVMEDIDMSEYSNEFFGIGFSKQPFKGNFDGNNKRISNLNLIAEGRGYAGMFGYISGTANVIQNIILENLSIQAGGSNTGGLVGCLSADDCLITNCRITNGEVYGGIYTGGLIGFNLYTSNDIISNCSSSADVYGTSYVGGLLGYTSNTQVYTSFALGKVVGTGEYIGGFIGRASNPMSIYDSYARGAVSGNQSVGGFVGYVWDYWYPVSMYRCYSTGRVTGNSSIGGFASGGDGSIYNCYWNKDTSGLTYGGNATGLSEINFKKQSSFAGWNFVNTWKICEATNYPRLQWQIPAGDFLCPDGVRTEDLDYFIGCWMLDNCTSSNNYCGWADIDSSGAVDLADFSVLAQHWLEGI